MSARRLPVAVRAALADALTPHDLTPALDTTLAAALAHYQAAGDGVTAAQWARRRAALARAAEASTALLAALDDVDRAWQQAAPAAAERGGWFVHQAHGALRREALACTAMWGDWITARHTPRTRPSHRPSDERRHHLALAILWALQDARVPLVLHRRQRSIAEDVVRVVFGAVGAPLGRDPYRQMRAWMTTARQVTMMIERRRTR
ncbi:MAG: hypothetical protein IT180_18990 [Acidobacteria bacterium]|nr:hypothetical protein [Acidobacteriota bacterium]